jgi:hypothetical protein
MKCEIGRTTGVNTAGSPKPEPSFLTNWTLFAPKSITLETAVDLNRRSQRKQRRVEIKDLERVSKMERGCVQDQPQVPTKNGISFLLPRNLEI